MNEKSPENTILFIVEDDDTIRELLELNLKAEGFKVFSFFSVEQMERRKDGVNCDLLLLDVMLPGLNGLHYAKKLKEEGLHIPILFVSALNQEKNISKGYELGAIDYIIKPFEINHLMHKVKNLLYHFVPRSTAPLPAKLGEHEINWDLLQVKTCDGQTFTLTGKEAEALAYFLENEKKIISRKELIEKIWGNDRYISTRNVDNFLVKFRKIFEIDPAKPKHFLTYPKKGYAFQY